MHSSKGQHVTDPSTCISCGACEMACATYAIQNIGGRFCIDAEKCNECEDCVTACPTGAADCYLETERVFSLFEQAEWQCLPVPASE